MFAPLSGILLLAVSYGLWQGVAGVGLIVMAFRDIDEAMAVWAMGGLVVGLPFSVVLAVLGMRMERAVRGGPVPSRWLWLPLSWGLVMVGHWLVMWLWPFALWGSAMAGGGGRAVELSVYGLWAVAAVLVGVVATVASTRALQRRAPGMAVEESELSRRRWLPTSLLLSVGALFACAIPSLMWVAWMAEDGWARGTGALAVGAWTLAAAGASVAAAGATRAWMTRAGRPVDRHLEVAGGVLVAHWAPMFLLALLPVVRIQDMRWSLIGAAFLAILIGTALWSQGRASPPLAAQG